MQYNESRDSRLTSKSELISEESELDPEDDAYASMVATFFPSRVLRCGSSELSRFLPDFSPLETGAGELELLSLEGRVLAEDLY